MKKIAVVMATVLSVFALPAAAEEDTWPREGRYDAQIRQQVTEELAKKDKFHDVSAVVEDGIVTLSGTVNLYIDKVNAEKRARKIKNVDGVRNHVTVEGKAIEDAQLRETLAGKLRYDRAGYGIVFNSLTLNVENGAVTVGGKVRDYPDRESAIAIVETTPGVKDVIDEIDVAPVSGVDDELRVLLARAIYGHASLQRYSVDPQAPIRIVVENGHVELSGVVLNKADSQIAYAQARSVPGVFSVKNYLMVAPSSGK